MENSVDENRGLIAAGAGLVWRRRRILWWVFAVNLALGLMGTVGPHRTLQDAIGHSLIGQDWYKGFDLTSFAVELLGNRVNLFRSITSSAIFAFLFFVFMLFVGGGILTAYRDDRRLTTEEFCAASGAFFWRFVRLAVLSLIPLGVLGFLTGSLNKLVDYVNERSIADQTSFYVHAVGLLVLGLLALGVRLWFDIAQVRAVAQGERKMWRNMWKSLRITWRNVGRLFWLYFLITLVALAVSIVGAVIWSKLPPTAIPVIFVLLELIMLAQIWARLWQRASAMVWYKRHAVEVPTGTVDYTTTVPVEVVEYPMASWTPPAEDAVAASESTQAAPSATEEAEIVQKREPEPLPPSDA